MIDFMLYEDERKPELRMIVTNTNLLKLINDQHHEKAKLAEEEFNQQHNQNYEYIDSEEEKDDGFMEKLFNKNMSN